MLRRWTHITESQHLTAERVLGSSFKSLTFQLRLREAKRFDFISNLEPSLPGGLEPQPFQHSSLLIFKTTVDP